MLSNKSIKLALLTKLTCIYKSFRLWMKYLRDIQNK